MQAINLPPTTCQFLVKTILKQWKPCSIFVFGYQSHSTVDDTIFNTTETSTATKHHFYILVFANNVGIGSAANMANTIAEASNNTITATLLVHKTKDLTTNQPSQQWFFDQVLRYGQRVALDKSAPPFIVNNTTPSKDTAGDKTFWLKCEAVALFNIQAAKESPQQEVALCKIALLHTACLQIALGLIRVYLGYTPNEFSLNYLLQLCQQFTPLPAQVFQKQTKEQQKRYKMLCAPPSMLQHWTKLYASEDDFNHLLTATQDFLNQAKTQIEKANI